MVDTGLDETSCFFADDDGLQVEHGHLFDGVRKESDGNVSLVFDNYSFAYDLSRRKVCGGGGMHSCIHMTLSTTSRCYITASCSVAAKCAARSSS